MSVLLSVNAAESNEDPKLVAPRILKTLSVELSKLAALPERLMTNFEPLELANVRAPVESRSQPVPAASEAFVIWILSTPPPLSVVAPVVSVPIPPESPGLTVPEMLTPPSTVPAPLSVLPDVSDRPPVTAVTS